MTPAEALQSKLGDAVTEVVTEGAHPFTRVAAEKIVEAARVLRDECGFDMLHQISGVDLKDKFEVVYHFTRIEGKCAFYAIKVDCDHDNPVVPTISHDWRAANWAERETWDLCGIRFEGHPHHFRILLPEDWVGHPLRKDYVMPTEYHGIDCTE